MRFLLILLVGMVFSPCVAQSQDSVATLRGDDAHSRRWNRFVDQLYALHQERLAGSRVREETRIGGYPRHPDFYEAVSYYDAENDRLLSRILWERATTEGLLDRVIGVFSSDADEARGVGDIHSIAVYFYDDEGRVIRDYSASYLPDHKSAPTQTLIFLHAYNGELHAFRSFDASDNRIFERCRGEYRGEAVDFELDEDALYDAADDSDSVVNKEVYAACFKGLPESAGEYLTPH